MDVRDFVLRALGPAALLLAGIVLMALTGRDDRLPFMIGWIAAALGAIALTLLFFYEVGRGEDRAREREKRSPR